MSSRRWTIGLQVLSLAILLPVNGLAQQCFTDYSTKRTCFRFENLTSKVLYQWPYWWAKDFAVAGANPNELNKNTPGEVSGPIWIRVSFDADDPNFEYLPNCHNKTPDGRCIDVFERDYRLDYYDSASGVSEALTVKSTTSAVNLLFQTSAGQSGEFTANANGLQFNAPLAGNDIYFRTQGSNPVVFKSGGSVGIGTTTPGQKLDVAGVIQTSSALYLGSGSQQVGLSGSDMFINTGSAERLRVTASGTVGIATSTPDGATKLHVAGAAKIDGALTAGSFVAKYQDLAEWVSASQPMMPGTVVVLDPDHINHVVASSRAYDTSVAGVISASPGILLGEAGDDKVKVATTGRVKVKAGASSGAIRVGDLLVTSDRKGTAMRSEPIDLGGIEVHRPGTVIGKALEPLAEGEREILVLLSLQ